MYCFLGPIEIRLCLVCFGSKLSKTDVILCANIISAGDNEDGVLRFGMVLYTCKNCCRAFSVGVPQAFLRALFKVSTKHSVWPWMVQSGCDVFYLESLTEHFKINWCELYPVVTDQTIYQPKTGEQFMKEVYCYLCSGLFTSEHFQPSALAIHYN